MTEEVCRLSKYQRKLKARWYETESGKLAYEINARLPKHYYVERNFKIKLVDNYYLESYAPMLLMVSRYDDTDPPNRRWVKFVPDYLTVEQMCDVLDSQPWCYL